MKMMINGYLGLRIISRRILGGKISVPARSGDKMSEGIKDLYIYLEILSRKTWENNQGK